VSNEIDFSAVNPAITSGDPPVSQGVIYQGVSATLDLTLTNSTGGPITLQGGAQASTFEIFMPQFWFTDAQLQAMVMTPPADWIPFYNAADESLMLTFAGTNGTIWPNGQSLSFAIASILTTAQPTSSSVQLNAAFLALQVQAPLALSLPPKRGNPDLTQVLQVSLQTQGSVYVSPHDDPLPNTLFLNLKNIGAGPLYSGTNGWSGTPQVIVTFVYGSTAGALAPDNDKAAPQSGSAWNIAAGIQTGSEWQAGPGTGTHPSWILNPTSTNKDIIGTGDSANITFSFSDIVSFTPAGHTQMYVQFTGIPAADGLFYNDAVYVLDIVKQTAPPTRGLLNFWGPAPQVTVGSATQKIDILLNWAMWYVDSIRLICSLPGIKPVEKSYPDAPSLGYDNAAVTIPGVETSSAITCTLQAFDKNKKELNALQFTVQVNFPPKIHSFTIEAAPSAEAWDAVLLKWEIAGQQRFEIVENDGSGNPEVLPIPDTAMQWTVSPIPPTTTYTLYLYAAQAVNSPIREPSKTDL
jgi:hypothetical protein